METFNVRRRDVHTFDDYMNLKKPGFGGPKSAKLLKDGRGKFIDKDRKLSGFQRTVKRDDTFKNQVFNPTYKAMGGDLVHKQEFKKNPYDYPDLYNNTGIGMVEVGETNEGKCYSNFTRFILESECGCESDCDCKDCKTHKRGKYKKSK
jgi:hypothetical protein